MQNNIATSKGMRAAIEFASEPSVAASCRNYRYNLDAL